MTPCILLPIPKSWMRDGTHRPGVWKLLQTDVCPMAHEDSLRLCGRGACDYVQAPKAKGPGTARFDGFPTPRSRVFRAVCGGAPQTISLNPNEEIKPYALCVIFRTHLPARCEYATTCYAVGRHPALSVFGSTQQVCLVHPKSLQAAIIADGL